MLYWVNYHDNILSVGSPTSATKSKGKDKRAMVATSGSSPEQSDDDEVETEAGQCEESTDPMDLKRIKRYEEEHNCWNVYQIC